MTYARQFALPFPDDIQYRSDAFLKGEANAEATAWLDRPDLWPASRLAIQGDAGVGKTHLLHVFAHRQGAALLQAEAVRVLMSVPETDSLAIDDADTIVDARALLHVMNIAAERGQSVLLSGRAAPAHWCVDLPDLASRLRSMSVATVRPPDDALLRSLLVRFMGERQLTVSERVQDYLLSHLPRTGGALREAAARLDRLALIQGGHITCTMAALAVETCSMSTPDRLASDYDVLGLAAAG